MNLSFIVKITFFFISVVFQCVITRVVLLPYVFIFVWKQCSLFFHIVKQNIYDYEMCVSMRVCVYHRTAWTQIPSKG